MMKDRLNILLIDDDEPFLRVSQQVLGTKYGWSCG